MTQPIQEPSTQRSVSGLLWGESQLARRPGPVPSAGGDLPWVRRRKLSDSNQAISDGSEHTVTFNDTVNDYPDYYVEGDFNGIAILVPGFYSITGRVYWDTAPTHAELYINGPDSDDWASYNGSSVWTQWDLITHASMNARLAISSNIFLSVYQDDEPAAELLGTGGSFLEIVRIGDVTTNDRNGGP